MANATIADLPGKSALTGAEKLEIDDGASKSATAQQIADLNDRSGVSALAIASSAVDVDLALGSYFTLLMTGNVSTMTVSQPPAAGRGRSIAIRVQQDTAGGRTLVLPASFHPITGSDTAIQLAASAYTLIIATSFDQGTRWEYSMRGISA